MVEIKDVLVLNEKKLKEYELEGKLVKNDILETLKTKKDVIPWVEIKSKKDEDLVVEVAEKVDGVVIISGKGFSLPPKISMENIVARTQGNESKIYACSKSFEDMLSTAKSMNVGLNVVVKDKRLGDIFRDYFNTVKFDIGKVKIKSVEPVGVGTRSCIDTAYGMEEGEGMLICSDYGDESTISYPLVHGETPVGKFTPPRRFRVNAGPICNYVVTGKIGDDESTKYLDEIKCGSRVLIVDKNGNARKTVVGRNKKEDRPLVCVTTETDNYVLLQEAETVCLTDKNGRPKSVLSLKKGDEILMYRSKGGMHGGMKI